jgi:hypothetical protein
MQNAIDTQAYPQLIFRRLNMDIRGSLAQRLLQNLIQ